MECFLAAADSSVCTWLVLYIFHVRCADSSFILAGQLLSAPYLCLPLVSLVLTPGSLLHCFSTLHTSSLRGTEQQGKENNGCGGGIKACSVFSCKITQGLLLYLCSTTPSLAFKSSILLPLHSFLPLRPLHCPPQ